MRSSISTRDIRPADLPDILSINAAASPGVCRLTSSGARRLVGAATLAWVAVEATRIVGYLIAFIDSADYAGEEFAWFKERGRHFVYIDQVALAPSYRGQGVGRALYAKVEQWGGAKRYRALNCEVNLDPPNPGSLAFHKNCGFVEMGRMHTSDGRQVALLQKEVSKRLGRRT